MYATKILFLALFSALLVTAQYQDCDPNNSFALDYVRMHIPDIQALRSDDYPLELLPTYMTNYFDSSDFNPLYDVQFYETYKSLCPLRKYVIFKNRKVDSNGNPPDLFRKWDLQGDYLRKDINVYQCIESDTHVVMLLGVYNTDGGIYI